MIAVRIAFLLTCLFVSAPVFATVAEHPDFTENRNRPQRLVLLPVEASITRGRLTDAESLIKETLVLERALTRESAIALQGLGYELDTEIVSAEALADDATLLAIMDEARDRALETLAKASQDLKGVARGRFTIDDAALALAAHSGAEGMLVLQSQSFIVSKGSKALGAVLNPFNLAATATRTQVAGGLFDMRDGQLLAIIVGREVGPVLKKPDDVARDVLESAFRDFPPRGTGSQAKAKFREAAPTRLLQPVPVIDADSQEATLAAFEEAASVAEAPVDRDATPQPEQTVEPTPNEATATPDAPSEDPPAPDDVAPPAPPPLTNDEQERLLDLLDTPADLRPKPGLQAVFLGDVADITTFAVRNMSPQPVRVSADRQAFVLLQPGELLELSVRPGSHRLLAAHAEEDRELVRATVIVGEGRVAIAELWPASD